MKKNSKSFLRNVFFPICLLALAVNFPLSATSNTEEDDHEKKLQISRSEIQLPKDVRILTENSSKEIVPIGSNLATIYTNVSEILVKPQFDIKKSEKDLRDNIGLSKEKFLTATSKLEQVNEYCTPDLIKTSSLGKITSLAALKAFLANEGIDVSCEQSEMKDSVHGKHAKDSEISYDGKVKYSGFNPCSGKEKYVHKISIKRAKCGSCNEFGPFPSGESNFSKCDYCGSSARYCSHCGKNFPAPTGTSHGRWFYKDQPSKIAAFDLDKEFEGFVYCKKTVPYSGVQDYSGKVVCKDHHSCECENLAQLILSFREVLEEKDFYEKAYKEQKYHLDLSKKAYEDIREVKTNLENAGAECEVLTALQNERSLFQGKAETIALAVQTVSGLIINRNALLENEVEALKAQLKEKIDDVKYIEQTKAEKDTVIKLGDLKQQSQSDISNLQKVLSNQETKIRSTLPSIFVKLCSKLDIKGEKRRTYLSALRNKELSVIELLEKVEEFIADDDFE